MYHPHHLIFSPVNHLIHNFYVSLTGKADPVFSSQLLNILFGSTGIVLFFLIARKLIESVAVQWICTMMLLFSGGWWRFSTQIEVYVPATVFLMAVIYIVFTQSLDNKKGTFWLLVISVLLSFSILFHQSNVLFCIPLVYWIYLQYGKKGIYRSLGVVSLAGLICILVYAVAIKIQNIPFNSEAIANYILKYAVAEQHGWGTVDNIGHMGLFELLKSQAAVLFRSKYAGIVVYFIFFNILILGIIGLSIYYSRKEKEKKDQMNLFRRFLLVWLMVYYLFFLWWLPGESEFFIVTNVPLLLLFVILQHDFSRRPSPSFLVKNSSLMFFLVIFGMNISQFIEAHIVPGNTELKANEARSLGTQDCYYMFDFEVEMMLKYLGEENVSSIVMYMTSFYKQEVYTNVNKPFAHECVVLDRKFLDPARFEEGFDPFSNPEQWAEFIKSVFDLKKSEGGIDGRAYRSINGEFGNYIVLSNKKQDYNDYKTFFYQLDSEVNKDSEGNKYDFIGWYNANHRIFN